MEDFLKFPTTPHLALLGEVAVRGDKVMAPAEREKFLSNEVVVEEKVDGANLGLSFDVEGNLRAQNRGAYLELPAAGQWKKLADWLAPREDILFEHLADRYILFGEWCYARHSISYDRLPDWFLGFDIFDKCEGAFWASPRRDVLLAAMQIAAVPTLARGHFTPSELTDLLAQSRLGDQPAEGLYLRREDGKWLQQRAKLVAPAFVQSIEAHWQHAGIIANRLRQA
jgi:ATP-dependent RNA circularization protein (DNA/RNA ligase family)